MSEVNCPQCGRILNHTSADARTHVVCPQCGPVEPVYSADAFLDDDATDSESVGTNRSSSAGNSQETKTCPMCGEMVLAAARLCRFCGERFDGGMVGGQVGVWRDGRLLVMHKQAKLPDRCVKSNSPASGWLRRRLWWHHPAVFLAILAGLLIYVILALVIRKHADIQIGLSRRWLKRRRIAIAVGWTITLAGVGLFVMGIAASESLGDATPLVILAGVVVGFIGAIAGLLGARMVAPTRITDEHLWLKGVHPDFLATLPEWKGANR